MVKIYPYAAGKTFGAHNEFLQKLRGVKKVKSPRQKDVIIIFCPIVSRFETDITAAMDAASSNIPGLNSRKVIMVAMHHTFEPNYTVPRYTGQNHGIALLVHCLFFENKGLLHCLRNEKACKSVRKELGLKKSMCCVC